MRNILGLAVLGVVMAAPASAKQSLYVSYPPASHKTTSDKIFLIGTAPPPGKVLVNGKAIARSKQGHFAPSFPLKPGDNLFTVSYQGQAVKLKVTRISTQPEPPKGLAFAKDSLTPSQDLARLPGELLCFGAVAPADANISVDLANQTIPLTNQQQVVQLPANSAALTAQNQPYAVAGAGHYLGCAAAGAAADLGRPQFKVEKNGQIVSQEGPAKIQILSPAQLEVAEVIVDAGVARTGPSTDYSRLTPLPKTTRATITGRDGEWVRLDYGGWINSKEVQIVKGSVPPRSLIRSIRARKIPGATEVIFPLQVPVPLVVQQGDRTLTLTLYNTTAQTDIIRLDPDPVISRLDWQQVAPETVQYTFNLKSAQQWGYTVRYEGTSLILSLRHPPRLTSGSSVLRSQSSNKPLSGIKIVLDPGHGGEDGGAGGPTGYPEKEVTLIMSKLIANQLIARGATVYLTREVDKAVSLPERVAIIDAVKPAISLSIHYNALPDGGDAQNTQGFGTFWYHPQAHSLAMFLHNYIVTQAGRPSYGVFWDNLALARPASAPSVLLELGFMSNPEEFEWVVNPQAQQKMAVAIAEGVTQWFKVAR
ncbi:N-acetylmuramoyl-L-alanine amidase [Coleofasciculus sp. FACHB-1120]|uniref:N-acetylmuramoyl-L-alanine amidase n=1 Tax=Coleofasciculus sp. FACHB-1120 TaxID=2692783 RepID=UPI0016853107|nr:N-acetylmuramoyl-L-alanine amidase [Coleofasciculus sp. FACHB-1120]MBD2744478.1 N-acetylmuramoyl-L-alanine amidase [Coleofasciculus sp. FACHB-1120]